MKIRVPLLTIVLTILILGCSKEDDSIEPGGEKSFDIELLYGTWAIFQGEVDGQVVDIPPTSPACGRDFFAYTPDGIYRDFVFANNSQCLPEVSELNWQLRIDILTLFDSSGQSLELKILELRSNLFIFTAQIDIDQDGVADTFKFTARPYSPPAYDSVSSTFQPNYNAPERIEFNWLAYRGGSNFSRYEIYRGTSCDKQSAQLVATIGDPETTIFIDESPESVEQLCYFIRIYTSSGLLGESDPIAILTHQIVIPLVSITDITGNGNQVSLNWEPYSGYYFSKYEIYVRNYEAGVTGYAFQEEKVGEITEEGVTSFTDTNPPYMRNPIYEVRVLNHFGNSSKQFGQGGQEALYERPGLLKVSSIYKWTYDKNEPTVYILGNSSESNQQNLLRFNYQTNETKISQDPPDTSSVVFMKVVDSEYGKEILLHIGAEVRVYDAVSLNLKYTLELNSGYVVIRDIDYLGNGIWLIAEAEKLFTFTRNNQTLSLIAEEDIGLNTLNGGQFQIVRLGGSRVLVGHEIALESYTFDIDASGNFNNKQTFSSIRWKDFVKTHQYNVAQNVLLDHLDRGIYETQNFSFIQFYPRPFLATGLSTDGNYILGTDNDPSWIIDENSLHARKAVRFNRATGSPEETVTVGFPLFVFENNLGQTVSISSWFKREGLNGFAPKPDIFIELID